MQDSKEANLNPNLGPDLSNFQVDPESGIAIPGSPVEQLVVPGHVAQDYAAEKASEKLAEQEKQEAALQEREEAIAELAKRAAAIRKSRRLAVQQLPSNTERKCQARVRRPNSSRLESVCKNQALWRLQVKNTIKRRKGGMYGSRVSHGHGEQYCWDHLPKNVQEWLASQGKAPKHAEDDALEQAGKVIQHFEPKPLFKSTAEQAQKEVLTNG